MIGLSLCNKQSHVSVHLGCVRGGSWGSARWGLTLSGHIAWRHPCASMHCTSESAKKIVSLILVDLFHVNR